MAILFVLPKTAQCCPGPRRPIHRVEGSRVSLQQSFSSEFALLAVPFVVNTKLADDVLTIVIVGELDVATVHLLHAAQRSVQGKYCAVRYELAGVGFMDSAGLRALLTPAGSDGPLREVSITHPTRPVRRLLELRDLQGMIAT